MERLLSRNEKVVLAAEDVFVRYGFARTTMGDIARAAGISRPALYLLFPDKETIFARVIEMMDARSLTKIERDVEQIERVQDKLLHACTVWGLHGIELASTHPDAADLFDFRFPAVRDVYARFQLFLVRMLEDSVANWTLPVSRAEFAATLTYGLRGLRYGATDVEHMKHLIEVHVTVYGASL
ncbi:TetR/AcrR family transcriptional regulator [Rhizobium pusense]|nr:TetR/AcrR family transcriptional regulator [Agrobacterium pusense]